MRLRVGDTLAIWVNQKERTGEILAVLDDLALVEYSMPKGTSGIRFYHADTHQFYNRVSYLALPSKWVEAIVHQGALEDLIGKPQQLGKGYKLAINICPDMKFVKVDNYGRN